MAINPEKPPTSADEPTNSSLLTTTSTTLIRRLHEWRYPLTSESSCSCSDNSAYQALEDRSISIAVCCRLLTKTSRAPAKKAMYIQISVVKIGKNNVHVLYCPLPLCLSPPLESQCLLFTKLCKHLSSTENLCYVY